MASNRYIDSFQRAKQEYQAQTERPGYPRGLLTFFRHSPTKNKAMNALESELNAAVDDVRAQKIIEKHFKSGAAFDNHSFNSYFLDVLTANFRDEQWCEYNPKPLVFYQGTLYRGTPSGPDVIFKCGFVDLSSSKSLDDYTCDMNGSIGVSTTTAKSIALSYALPMVRLRDMDNAAVTISSTAYVYEINYRGCEGIDIEATQIARGNSFRASCASNKKEVNIVGNIKSSDIVRAWKYRRGASKPVIQEELANPAYLPARDCDVEPESKIVVKSRDFGLRS